MGGRKRLKWNPCQWLAPFFLPECCKSLTLPSFFRNNYSNYELKYDLGLFLPVTDVYTSLPLFISFYQTSLVPRTRKKSWFKSEQTLWLLSTHLIESDYLVASRTGAQSQTSLHRRVLFFLLEIPSNRFLQCVAATILFSVQGILSLRVIRAIFYTEYTVTIQISEKRDPLCDDISGAPHNRLKYQSMSVASPVFKFCPGPICPPD